MLVDPSATFSALPSRHIRNYRHTRSLIKSVVYSSHVLQYHAHTTMAVAHCSARYSGASFESLKSHSSQKSVTYSHPLYSAQPAKLDNTFIIVEESRFSSCSTSPNSSYESLGTCVTPSQRQSGLSTISVTPSTLSAALSRPSSNRTSKSSFASSRYADDHYPLISNVSSPNKSAHGSILSMAHAYNTYIRAINSCFNHALSVGDDEISDFLFFNQTLFNILSQHLKFDKHYLQPLLHKPVVHPHAVIRKTTSIHENDIFQMSFHLWANYIHDPASQEFFSGEDIQARLNVFAPLLIQHLHDEVSQLNTLVNDNVLMPGHLNNIWTKFEDSLSACLDLYTDTTLLVGCHDRYFTINGQRAGHKFPRLPVGTTTLVKKWHSRKYDSAWRFCSSDFSGKRRVIS